MEISSAFVRFQVALTAGEMHPDSGPLLAKLLRRKDADTWLNPPCSSSAKDCGDTLLESLAARRGVREEQPRHARPPGRHDRGSRRRQDDRPHAAVARQARSPEAQSAILDGLGQGSRNSAHPLNRLWDNPPAELKPAVEKALTIFTTAAKTVTDEKATPAARLAAIRLLASGPYRYAAEPLAGLLDARFSGELQSAALKSLASFDDPRVADAVLAGWEGYGPDAPPRGRRSPLRPHRPSSAKLLDAIEAKKVLASHIEAARADALRKHPDAKMRARAERLFAGQVDAGPQEGARRLQAGPDAEGRCRRRAARLFRKNCTACHRLENTGYEVGANLLAALRNKSKEALLIDILDPSREVDSRYVNYQVRTTAGRTVSGTLAVETPTSITLRRGEKAEDTILRSQIEEIRSTSKSLMPEEFEKQLSKQQLADLIAYLLKAGK